MSIPQAAPKLGTFTFYCKHRSFTTTIFDSQSAQVLVTFQLPIQCEYTYNFHGIGHVIKSETLPNKVLKSKTSNFAIP